MLQEYLLNVCLDYNRPSIFIIHFLGHKFMTCFLRISWRFVIGLCKGRCNVCQIGTAYAQVYSLRNMVV